MAFTITFELSVTVNDDEQAQKILDAVSSGLAETAIKDRVLFDGTGYIPGSARPTFASSAKAAEASKELKPVETHAGKKQVPTTPEPAPERTRGVLGNRRLGRTGRG